MSVIHNGASAPLLFEVYFIICRRRWSQPKILSLIHCVENTLGSGRTERYYTLCFSVLNGPQIGGEGEGGEEMVHLVAVQGGALITISIFVFARLSYCVEFITVFFVFNCT